MAMIIKTTIRNLRAEYKDAQSWEDNGGNGDDWDELEECEYSGSRVMIMSEATDGYFDVKLPSGKVVEALSVHHLDGFKDDETNTIIFSELVY